MCVLNPPTVKPYLRSIKRIYIHVQCTYIHSSLSRCREHIYSIVPTRVDIQYATYAHKGGLLQPLYRHKDIEVVLVQPPPT
jgi:hypothetical protein